jgi:hypothetical protein
MTTIVTIEGEALAELLAVVSRDSSTIYRLRVAQDDTDNKVAIKINESMWSPPYAQEVRV